MRADRLFSLLMLLQTRGRATAEELANEMEVSVRTIYRDMEALSIAGIPVYAERGPGGGCALMGDYRTTLTGLTDEETRSLYMLNIPAPLEALGVGQKLKTALLKLYASMPAYRQEEAGANQRVLLDWAWWGQGEMDQVPVLKVLYDAIWQERLLKISYLMFTGRTIEHHVVAPLGLTSKGGMWYVVLMSNQKIFAHRVVDLLKVDVLEQTFDRPDDFNLSEFWKKYCEQITENFSDFEVRVKVDKSALLHLYRHFSFSPGHMGPQGTPDPDGRIPMQLYYESFEMAREHILSLGRAVEVVEPEALRFSVLDFALQTVHLYQAG